MIIWLFSMALSAIGIVIVAPDLLFDFSFKLFKISTVLLLAKYSESFLFPGGHELERPIIVGAMVIAMGATL